MVNLKAKPDSSNFNSSPKNDEQKQDNISVLLVDDQKSIREKLRISIEPESDLEIIGSVADGQTAIAEIESLHPDIVLIDVEMPGMDGLEATQIIREHYAHTKVIVLSSHDHDHYIDKALKAGAKGYLLKNTPATEIVHAIRYVHKGYLQLGPGLFEKLESSKLRKQLEKAAPSYSQNHSDHLQVVNSQPTKSLTPEKSAQSSNNDWSSLTKELVETLPRVWTRGLLYFLMVFVGIILPWAMLSKIDETGSARGKLEPQGKVFAVDTPVSGTVAEVFVKEGQSVEEKQPLIALESKPVESELQQARTKLEGQQKELAGLKLLKNQLVVTVNTQRQQNSAQQFEKQAQLDQERHNIQHNQTAQQLAKTSYDEALKEVQRFLRAKEKGIVSEIQVTEREESVRERKRLLEQANADTEQAKLRFKEQEKSYQSLIHSGNIAVLKSEEQLKEIETQIGTLSSQIKETQSQIESLNYQLEQRIVKAPTSGSIFQLPVTKTGSVLEPGGLVAEIAPKQAPLVLKAQMTTSESGSLDRGMPVKLKFDAYPFQDFGIVEGKLVSISPTTKVIDTEQGQIESYELEVKLDQNYIQAKNKRVLLRPGQTATAEVIVRQRRLIDFVLDPFKKLQKDGLEL